MIKFNFSVQEYSVNKSIDLDANCNGITAINAGGTTVNINGMPLRPNPIAGLNGDSFTIGGNGCEILSTRLQVSFESVAGQTNKVIIIQKYYL